MKISKYPTRLLLTVFFSVALASCSSGGSSSNNKKTTPPPAPAPNTPALELSPQTEFNFGEVTVGNTAEPLILTITNLNTATARLEISSILLSDTNNFKLNTSAGNATCLTASPALDKAGSCTVEVTFEPNAIGPLTATLEILSNDANSPAKFSLSGTSTQITELNVTINQIEADRTTAIICPANPLKVAAIVSVTDQAGFPVKGLKAADFNISENPASTTPATVLSATPVGNTSEPLFLSILMDYSQSMNPIDLAAMEAEVIKMVNQLNPTDKAEIIKFTKFTYTFDSSKMKFVIDDPTTDTDNFDTFTSDKALLETAIKLNVADVSGTAYYDALELGINDVKIAEDANEALNPRKAVILITDGVDTDSVQFKLPGVILNAKNNEVPVYVAGIAAGSKSNDLKKLANDTSAFFYKADVSENLATIFQQQLAALLFSDQYVVRYDSENSVDSTIDFTVNASKTGVPPSGTGTDTHTRQTTLCPPPL